MRKFEYVMDAMKRTNRTPTLPTRSTQYSAGYDFVSNGYYEAKPNEIVKIWTDVKCYMNNDEVLLIDVRSSMGGKWALANTIGVIDSDYVNNDNNDGNIGIFLKNISNDIQTINVGDKIAQGIFVKYLITDDDIAHNKRNGGFGSTN